jgi:TFIIF-interacting CTD phosphatase-like protein
MHRFWTIIVFTAGLKDYADEILDDLDTECYIHRRLYRDSCKQIEGVFCKDLNSLSEHESTNFLKTVIVDNIPENYALQHENGIQIKSWYEGDKDDKELSKLAKILQ